jgi:hypothetical protein
MRRVAKLSAVVLALALASCVDDPPDDAGPAITGVLIDPAGQPLAGVAVLACQASSCANGETDPDGRFHFVVEPPADVALKTHPNLAGTPRLAAALEPVDILDDTLIDLGTVYVPGLPSGAVIGPATDDPQTLAVGDGLELTFNGADLTPALGEFLYDIAARRLPEEHVPAYAELSDEQIVAVYALHPFAASSASPIAVRAPADLPDGTLVWFRTVGELDGNCSEPVLGEAQGGYVTTAPGAGITRLTYLVISR